MERMHQPLWGLRGANTNDAHKCYRQSVHPPFFEAVWPSLRTDVTSTWPSWDKLDFFLVIFQYCQLMSAGCLHRRRSWGRGRGEAERTHHRRPPRYYILRHSGDAERLLRPGRRHGRALQLRRKPHQVKELLRGNEAPQTHSHFRCRSMSDQDIINLVNNDHYK